MPILLATYSTNKLIDTKRYVSETRKKETINRQASTQTNKQQTVGNGKRQTAITFHISSHRSRHPVTTLNTLGAVMSLNSTITVAATLRGKFTCTVCGLPDADRQRYIDKFKSLGVDERPHEIPRNAWTDNSVAVHDVDNDEVSRRNDV